MHQFSDTQSRQGTAAQGNELQGKNPVARNSGIQETLLYTRKGFPERALKKMLSPGHLARAHLIGARGQLDYTCPKLSDAFYGIRKIINSDWLYDVTIG